MHCVRSIQYSFALNGELIGKVNPSRGLRQRDPLSPYLFVLCAHGLSAAILAFERRHLITGICIASTCPLITHLFFADDSLLFFRATLENCEGVCNCLRMYEKASGQLINYEKSALSFSSNTSEDMIHAIKTRLSIPVVQEHEIYLGLPVCSMRNKKLKFRYLIERVSKRLQGWVEKSSQLEEKRL